VRFSEEAEIMVGRQHAKITRNPALTFLFFITDLNSRNGTFVNQQRIFGTASLKPGDVVQCGLGGPEFRFDVEPDTDQLGAGLSPTANLLEQARVERARPDLPPAASPSAALGPIAGTRVEPLRAPAKDRSRKRLIVGGGILIGVLALVAGFLLYRSVGSNGSSGAEGLTSASPPAAGVGKYGHAHLSGGDTAEAEKDAERTAWRLEVAPYLVLGSGRPGNTASDFDKPDGVAFSPTGLLFATDAGNRRVQVWDVKTGARLAEFGHKVFGGEIVDVAIAPDNLILVTDQTLNLAYAFATPQLGALDEKGEVLGPYDYQFKGTRFGEQGFQKLGGIAVDSRGRVYAVDAHRNDVLRFNPDGAPDKTWKFERTRADGDTYLHGCEGIAIDETTGHLFIASEKDAVVEVFDRETGAYKHRLVGAGKDASDKPAGKRIFFGSVRGLTVTQHHLLAVDESAGRIQIFDLSRPDAFNTDLARYAAPQPGRPAGYRGFFGHAPLVDFEDRTNTELQQQVKAGSIIPGQANPPGHFCSPDSIASYTDQASGETYIAIADQCNYRLLVYRWSEIAKAMGAAVAPAGATLATNEAKAERKAVGAAASKSAGAARSRSVAPSRIKLARTGSSKSTITSGGKGAVKGSSTDTVAGKSKEMVKSSGKEAIKSSSDATVSGKKEKKAKKEKKVKNKP
jgi:sugar lactone lactonase YvrE